jgi:uncharacterized repeat protein (TIGR03803 family)
LKIFTFGGYVFSVCAAAAMLAGCGRESTPLIQSPTGITANQTNAVAAYRILYKFGGGSDGEDPVAGLINVRGTLYGTTADGGDGTYGYSCCGTVFSISESGRETVLHRFKGGSADGVQPVAPLLAVNGTLYGTTYGGGAKRRGTVFAITMSGKETVLYSFKGRPDGAQPLAPLIDVNGTLWGTTTGGGAKGNGTVFAITMSGKETVLYSFKGGSADGQNPYGGLVNVKGKLYGTTDGGGAHCINYVACGTVFSITTSGNETVLYSFKGGKADGQNPKAGLVYREGKLYGTTSGGGYNASEPGNGIAFAVTPSGAETVLHRFGYRHDGAIPQAALLDVNGTLYGTTTNGGAYGYGTVFEILASGKERVLYNFADHGDGYYPMASLISVKGSLYGTTPSGGGGCYSTVDEGCGTVFVLKP